MAKISQIQSNGSATISQSSTTSDLAPSSSLSPSSPPDSEDGGESGSAVAAAREWGPAGALELDVAAHAMPVYHLSEQDRASVPELW